MAGKRFMAFELQILLERLHLHLFELHPTVQLHCSLLLPKEL